MRAGRGLKHDGRRRQLQGERLGGLPGGWDEGLADLFPPDTPPIATRKASGQVPSALAQRVHALSGGSADLAPSTTTTLVGYGDFGWNEYCGHNMHFGVREHAMGAIAGGMALHGSVIPYAATFLIFADYMRPPMRLAALMKQRVIYIFTHDSIGLGEDGPTGLILTRQKLPVLDRTSYASAENLQRSGYVLWQSDDDIPDVILIGTGSETYVALEAGKKLAADGVKRVRVVSLPSWQLFGRQPANYREGVLPPAVQARVAVEAGTKPGWEHNVGLDGAVVGMDGFEASAPGEVLYEQFGITAENVVAQAKALLGQ